MSVKRRDNRGRILKNGESQRKDGRYVYKYIDGFENQKFIYSWRLTETDPIPKGKREDISLREKEKEILKDIQDGINSTRKDMTVLELVEYYISQKRNVKDSTQNGYKFVVNFLKKNKFAMKKIDTVKKSDVKVWLVNLKDNGYAYNTIGAIRKVLRPSFEMAVDDDLIRKNPFHFNISDILENDTEKRNSLNEDEEKKFLDWIKEYEHSNRSQYYDDIFILLNTGLRISELCGLTLKDIDFDNKVINVNKQLIKTKQMEYKVITLKTKNSYREIPMTNEVYLSFQNIIKNKRTSIINEIDGVKDFIFIDYYGKPKVSSHYHNYFNEVIKQYNENHDIPLPHITPHVLRHTFCTKMVYKGINPKVLQYLMGHSDINITLNLYTHASVINAYEEMQRIQMI